MAQPAAAVDAGAALQKPVAPVTVTGKRRSEQELIRTVIAPFVDLHAARDRKSGLLVRFAPGGVCPLTLGLSEAFDDFVTKRIVTVAASVGAPVQKIGRCRPNVEIVFTDDPESLVNKFAKRSWSDVLGYREASEIGSPIHISRPIQVWYATGTLNAMSISDPQSEQWLLHSRAPIGVVVDKDVGQNPRTGTGSHLAPNNSSQILNALILVDTRAVDGQEIGPLADYVAMLALSQARLRDDCGPLPSILDLMASACPTQTRPQTLTDGDLAFLKALYASDISTSAAAAQVKVEKGMVKGLDSPKGAE